MSNIAQSPSNESENVIDGSDRFAAYARKQKMKKLAGRFVFAAVAAVTVIAAVKYVSTPVPEWADDSEDV